MNRLNAKAFALALGILWSASLFIVGLMAIFCSWAKVFVDALGTMYLGYSATIVGSLVGAAWGFVDGFVGGFIFAWLYNKLIK